MLNFVKGVAGQLGNILVPGQGGIPKRHRDDFFIGGLVIHHLDNPDGIALHQRQRHDGLLAEHQHIQRIAVVGVGAGDKAVVGRIVGGCVQHPIQPQKAGLLVHFVFILAALGDFDDGGEILRLNAFRGDVVPYVHACRSFGDDISHFRRRMPEEPSHYYTGYPAI